MPSAARRILGIAAIAMAAGAFATAVRARRSGPRIVPRVHRPLVSGPFVPIAPAPAGPIPKPSLLRFLTMVLGLTVLLTTIVLAHLILRGWQRYPADPVFGIPGADADRGRLAIIQHGCGACHVIPGIRNANGRVGPQLTDLRNQVIIAGQLPNTPSNLAAWIRNPQQFAPGTAMPNLNVSEPAARDIAAYLYSND